MHPGPQVAWQAREARQAPLKTPQPDRHHVRATEGLATRSDPIRQVPKGLPLRRRSRRYRHILAMTRERVLALNMMARMEFKAN